MGNGEWGMENGEWGMGNGEWGMGNGEWGMEEVQDRTSLTVCLGVVDGRSALSCYRSGGFNL